MREARREGMNEASAAAEATVASRWQTAVEATPTEEGARDALAVLWAEDERPEDQQIQRALKQRDAFRLTDRHFDTSVAGRRVECRRLRTR